MKIYLNKSRKKDEKVSRYWINYYYAAACALFNPRSINGKNPPEKISYAQGEWNFLTLILKNLLYFWKRKPWKKNKNKNK